MMNNHLRTMGEVEDSPKSIEEKKYLPGIMLQDNLKREIRFLRKMDFSNEEATRIANEIYEDVIKQNL